ncbi:hypothetical protein V8C42DRAFT_328004 [Trichoderma barbatum]
MMDSLTTIGAISAVAGLVDLGTRVCVSLNGMVKHFPSKPEAMYHMAEGVSSLVSVLHRLQIELENGDLNSLCLSPEGKADLRGVFESCRLVLTSLEVILDKMKHYPKQLDRDHHAEISMHDGMVGI